MERIDGANRSSESVEQLDGVNLWSDSMKRIGGANLWSEPKERMSDSMEQMSELIERLKRR